MRPAAPPRTARGLGWGLGISGGRGGIGARVLTALFPRRGAEGVLRAVRGRAAVPAALRE